MIKVLEGAPALAADPACRCHCVLHLFGDPFMESVWNVFATLSGSIFAPNPSLWEHFCQQLFEIIFAFVLDHLLIHVWLHFWLLVWTSFHHSCECHKTKKMHTVLFIKQVLLLPKLHFDLNFRSRFWSQFWNDFYLVLYSIFGSIGAPVWSPRHTFSSSFGGPFFARFLESFFNDFGTQMGTRVWCHLRFLIVPGAACRPRGLPKPSQALFYWILIDLAPLFDRRGLIFIEISRRFGLNFPQFRLCLKGFF